MQHLHCHLLVRAFVRGSWKDETVAETLSSIVAGHLSSKGAVRDTIRRTYERIAAAQDPAIFISLRDEAEVLAEADKLESRSDRGSRPLLGVPVAVKDNIDVAGLPTTAGCPAFAYRPERDATAVARLRQAGALIIGKTNLDQFATGLVGVRSPYGVPRNAMKAELVPGGSSSGSAVAVARGIVPLALGTDTAGSGRVPAGLNNICGLKPSLGLVSTRGVLPACRSLDCVSVFTLIASDAFAALRAMAGPDQEDAFSRALSMGEFGGLPPRLRLGVPRAADRIHFGDTRAEASFVTALDIARRLGAEIVEIDLTPFLETARLLYEGAWVAERTAAVGDFIAGHGADVHPVTRAIIEQGTQRSAVDAFRGLYRLAGLRTIAARVWAGIDALMVPTAPAAYTMAEVAASPVELNSRLGTYTNFVNLLDLAGFAVPATIAADGTPFGATFLAPAGRDAFLATLAGHFHAATGLPLGALGEQAALPPSATAAPAAGEIALAVVGAHLSGMPLNHELIALGARFLEATVTVPDYRLYALANTVPAKPGLLRVAAGAGGGIEVETWAMRAEAFGRFVDAVPPPLTIGSVRLADGRHVKGFLVEAEGLTGARDVTAFGGWRKAVASLA